MASAGRWANERHQVPDTRTSYCCPVSVLSYEGTATPPSERTLSDVASQPPHWRA